MTFGQAERQTMAECQGGSMYANGSRMQSWCKKAYLCRQDGECYIVAKVAANADRAWAGPVPPRARPIIWQTDDDGEVAA